MNGPGPAGSLSAGPSRVHARRLHRDLALRMLQDSTAGSSSDPALAEMLARPGARAVLVSLLPEDTLSVLTGALDSAGFLHHRSVRKSAGWVLVAVPAGAEENLYALLEEGGAERGARWLRRALEREESGRPARVEMSLPGGRRLVLGGGRTRVMGILNVTPDSFYPDSRVPEPEEAASRGEAMAEAGADILDVGGESTRPGAAPVGPDQEAGRVVPVLEELRRRLPGTVLSVDTRNASVAAAALEAGADMVNDVSAGLHDADMYGVAAEAGAALVLMHMRGTPQTMQEDPRYDDVVAEVCVHLLGRAEAAEAAGVAPDRVLLDPGIGFGKTLGHNLVLLREVEALRDLGRPVVLGTSRKSFLGAVLGLPEASQRLEGTLATVALAAARGVEIVRVHDAREAQRVCRVVHAVEQAAPFGRAAEGSEESRGASAS